MVKIYVLKSTRMYFVECIEDRNIMWVNKVVAQDTIIEAEEDTLFSMNSVVYGPMISVKKDGRRLYQFPASNILVVRSDGTCMQL